MLKAQILEFDRRILAWHRSNETSKRLDEIPGVGPRSPPHWWRALPTRGFPIGTRLFGLDRARAEAELERRQGKARQHHQAWGPLSAQPAHGRRAGRHRHAKILGTKHRPWLTALLARRPAKVAAVALANKIARMAWAMMAKGERYKEPVAWRRERDRVGQPA